MKWDHPKTLFLSSGKVTTTFRELKFSTLAKLFNMNNPLSFFLLFTLLFSLPILNGQPANDFCADAIPIAIPTTTSSSIRCFSPEFILPFSSDGTTDSGVPQACLLAPGNDQWFTWASTSGELLFQGKGTGSGSGGFPTISIFSDCTEAGLGNAIDCFDSAFDTTATTLSGWISGDEILIQISSFEGSSSDVGFCLKEMVALPVTLSSFEGLQLQRTNLLTWVTETEENTERHQIERSSDGKHWEAIGQVDAVGFSNKKQHYAFEDRQPIQHSYYRLKSIDFDQSYQYSKMINIERKQDQFSLKSLFPNPVNTQLTVVFNNEQKGKVNIEISDLTGRIVYQNSYKAQEGVNQPSIGVSDLTAGIYLLKLSNGNTQLTKRFVRADP